MQQKEDKVRLYVLARELNMETRDLLDLCRQAGIDVKNQLSSLTHEQREQVEQMARKGAGGVATAAPPKAVAPPTVVPQRVRVLDSRPTARTAEPPRPTLAPPRH